jgi:hypothetical protein
MPKNRDKPVYKNISITSHEIDMKINITPQVIHRGISLVNLPKISLDR